MEFPTTRSGALAGMRAFLPNCRVYGRDRNFVMKGHANVSRLSPMLRHRLLLEDEVADAAIAAHGFGRVEKFVQEVYWRRYWKAWLSLRPQVWQEACGVPGPCAETDAGAMALRVMAADSGNAVIDHFSRELVESGYLHNHARMWVAAWWIHHAGLPWQWGAAFFMQHLLDGDPASNTLSWRWVAGLQTPGKTYLARRANLEKYLDAAWVAEFGSGLSDFENPQPRLPESIARPEISVPDLPMAKPISEVPTGLWIHEEDLMPEHSPVGALRVDAILVAGHSAGWQRHGYSRKRVEWLESALADATCRATKHWQQVAGYETPENLAGRLVAWAGAHGLRQIVTLRPDVGPLNDELPEIQRVLDDAGIHLALFDRPGDLALRPLARRGFFDFWKKLAPRIREKHEPGLFPVGSDFPS